MKVKGLKPLGWLACVLMLNAAAAQAQPPPRTVGAPPAEAVVKLQTQQVVKDLFLISGGGGNTLVRKTPAGALIVDTKLPGKNVYDALTASLASIDAGRVKYVLLTHYHGDHSGNVGPFKAAGAKVIAQANVPAELKENPEGLSFQKRPAYPNITFKNTYTLNFGGTEVKAYYFGPAHTGGDAVYYFPQLKLIAGGDVLSKNMPNAEYPGGGRILGIQHFLHEVAKLDFNMCVPGHGGPMTHDDVLDLVRRWDLLVERIRALVKAGTPKEEFFNRLKTDDLGTHFVNHNWTGRINEIYYEFSQS